MQETLVPLPVGGDRRFDSVGVGAYHTCALARDGSIWCWGSNNYYQVGNDLDESVSEPILAVEGNDWIELHVGTAHNCSLRCDHSLWCWGQDEGQIGDGSAWRAEPVLVRFLAE